MSHKYPALSAMLLFAAHLGADELVFDSDAAWADWQQPFGLTEIGNEGQLQLVKFRKDINAVEAAPLFSPETREPGAMSSFSAQSDGGSFSCSTMISAARRPRSAHVLPAIPADLSLAARPQSGIATSDGFFHAPLSRRKLL